MTKKEITGSWDYYRISLKLLRMQLGTCTEVSIWEQHKLKKDQAQIKLANKMGEKVRKEFQKYKGSEITEAKELAEIQAIVRRFQELTGRAENIPVEHDKLMEYALELEKEFTEMVKEGDAVKATCFMRDKEGRAIVSSHMIIGNLKENMKIIANNSTFGKEHPYVKSKVSAQEMITLDIKPVEEFLRPSEDIVRDKEGNPKILERPIRFEDKFGNTVTAIAMSEYLPEGTEYEFHIRVRRDSPLNRQEVLEQLFDYGKSNGLGQNRRSGFGQYCYKLEKLDYDPTPMPEGWK